MFDIQSELLVIKQQREREYISIINFLDFVKQKNSNSNFFEIAVYLSMKLKDYDLSNQEGLFYFEDCEMWISNNGIITYRLPQTLDKDISPMYNNDFFNALQNIKDNFESVENYFLLLTNTTPTAKDYLSENFHNVYISRSRIEDLLKIQIPLPFETKLEHIQQKVRHTAMDLTNADEFVKNTDINKSPVGLAERLVFEETLRNQTEQIAEQQAEIDRLKAENEHLRSNQAQDFPSNEPSPTVSSKSSESKDQMIAIMAGELAKRQNNLRKGTGAINKAELARFLCSSEINTLFKDPKSDETFRQILKPLQLNSNE